MLDPSLPLVTHNLVVPHIVHVDQLEHIQLDQLASQDGGVGVSCIAVNRMALMALA